MQSICRHTKVAATITDKVCGISSSGSNHQHTQHIEVVLDWPV